jgi:hypothetical protein
LEYFCDTELFRVGGVRILILFMIIFAKWVSLWLWLWFVKFGDGFEKLYDDIFKVEID